MADERPRNTAIRLPEILLNVLTHLEDDQQTLASALRVSRLWFDLAVPVLWNDAPWKALALVTEHRRPLYANRITSLKLSGNLRPWREVALIQGRETLGNILIWNGNRLKDENALRDHAMWQYFAPSIRAISIDTVVLDDGVLNDLRTRCCKLTSLTIQNCGKKITPDALLSFVSQYTSLERIVLDVDGALIPDALIVHFAERPGLLTLGMKKHVPTGVLDTIAASVAAPFAKLENLDLTISCPDVPLVTAWAGSLTRLSLFVIGSEGDVLPHISSLRQLRSLKLGFYYPRVLSRAEIMTLRHLVNLVELHIPNGGSSLDISDEEFSHHDFDDLFSRLSHLRRLYFGVFYTMTIDTLDSLSKHCPELEELELPVDVDKLELEKRPGAMFPNLRLVEFSAIVWFDNKRIGQDEYDKRELVLLIKRHMPKLEDLVLGTVRLGEEALNSNVYNVDEDGTPVSVGTSQPL